MALLAALSLIGCINLGRRQRRWHHCLNRLLDVEHCLVGKEPALRFIHDALLPVIDNHGGIAARHVV